MLIVFSILESVYFERFLHSPMYKKYKSELFVNTTTTTKTTTRRQLSQNTQPTQTRCEVGNDEEVVVVDEKEKDKWEKESAGGCKIPHEDSTWGLSMEDGGNDVSKMASTSGAYNLNSFRRKLDKFKNLISLSARQRKSIEDDEYELAQKVAAQLINDVIRSNQL